MSVEEIRADRIRREKVAADRAKALPDGEYHAFDHFVVDSKTRQAVVECETHWDACLVLIAKAR